MKKQFVKFALDLLMAITFVLLFNVSVLGGLSFHEMAGLGIGVAVIVHVLLNAGWVKRVTMKMFDRKLPWKTRFEYGLNLLLLVSMAFNIVSGIIISRVVFPQVTIGNEMWFKVKHISVSFLVLAIVGLHVGLHWHWVMNMVKKMAGRRSSSRTLQADREEEAEAVWSRPCSDHGTLNREERHPAGRLFRVNGVQFLFAARPAY